MAYTSGITSVNETELGGPCIPRVPKHQVTQINGRVQYLFPTNQFYMHKTRPSGLAAAHVIRHWVLDDGSW